MSSAGSDRVDDDALIEASGVRRSWETAATCHLLGEPSLEHLLSQLGPLYGESDLVGEEQ